MSRISTVAWEDGKSEHTTCLCYSEAKGLYVSMSLLAPEEDILFYPHGYKVFWEKAVQLPKERLSIKIMTNFGYSSMTYMKAIVEQDGKRLLDFDNSKVIVLNNCSIMTLDVEQYAWERLFEKIISISDSFNPNQCTSSALSYVEEINNLFDESNVLIKGTLNEERLIKWDGEFLVTLFAAKKIKDLIKGISAASITDEYFVGKCNLLVNKFLQKLQVIEIDLSDKRTVQLAGTLFDIHEFMHTNKENIDFLRFFISKHEKMQ